MYGFIPPNTRGRLSITIHEANLVKNYGLVKMDPYIRIRVGHAGFETQTNLSGGRNPVWNRTIHAYLPVGVDSIYVQIFDERAFSSDELIAWQHILLPETIFNGDTVDDYYQLSGPQGENKEGMLHLTFSFAPIEQPVQGPGGVAQQAVREPVQITEEDLKEFADMFPSVDKEVVKCILEEKRGNKEATVNALLEMTQ
ncbi:hypothetical protein WR25_11909 isoform B [Diploscapter pachys]|nr:hypothetical protein WR25_11909 isoform B [Diploscapter pachys]